MASMSQSDSLSTVAFALPSCTPGAGGQAPRRRISLQRLHRRPELVQLDPPLLWRQAHAAGQALPARQRARTGAKGGSCSCSLAGAAGRLHARRQRHADGGGYGVPGAGQAGAGHDGGAG